MAWCLVVLASAFIAQVIAMDVTGSEHDDTERTKFIKQASDDDETSPEKLAELEKYFERFPSTVFFFHPGHKVDVDKKFILGEDGQSTWLSIR